MKLWDADSAYAWASLQFPGPSLTADLRVLPTIRDLFEGKGKAARGLTNERHRLIIIFTLSMMLLCLEQSSFILVGGQLGPGLDHPKQKVLEVLGHFSQTPSLLLRTHPKLEVARVVQEMHLVHMSHLHAAGGLMRWINPFLRKVLLSKPSQSSSYQTARVIQWGAENPRRVREVAYHCAQILALTRQFPENMCMEAFNTFHAGIILLCMARLLTTSQNTDQSGDTLRIDYQGDPDDPTSRGISEWVHEGGNEVIGVHGAPVLCCEQGWGQVLDETAALLTRRRVWGIAQNLVNVVLTIRSDSFDVLHSMAWTDKSSERH